MLYHFVQSREPYYRLASKNDAVTSKRSFPIDIWHRAFHFEDIVVLLGQSLLT